MTEPLAPPSIDAVLPPQMAAKAAEIGIAKATMPAGRLFVLGILAGAFIALGAAFSTTSVAGAGDLPYGVVRVIAGLTFCLGLILVVVAGAELFTGNNLIVMAWADGRVTTRDVLRNWAIVYAANFVGSAATAVLVFVSAQYALDGGSIGATALRIAAAKCSLSPLSAFALGVLCNALVCLAVWLCYSARSTTDKVLSIVPPITAFVACGFEHSVANMYFVPIAILIRRFAPDSFWQATNLSAEGYSQVTTVDFLLGNLLPVTLGNIVGGAVLVGAVYWFVYLRSSDRDRAA